MATAHTRQGMTPSASASSLTASAEGNRSGTISDEDDRMKPVVSNIPDEGRLLGTLSNDLHEFFEAPNDEQMVSHLFVLNSSFVFCFSFCSVYVFLSL